MASGDIGMYRPNEPKSVPPGKSATRSYRPVLSGSLLDRAQRRERGSEAFDGRTQQPRATQDNFEDLPPSDPGDMSGGSVFARLISLRTIGIEEIFIWLWQGIARIMVMTVICAAIAFAYAKMADPRYTSYTDILVAPSNLNVVSDDVFTASPQSDAQLLEVESKLRTLTSRNVLTRVIEQLRLTNDPEFVKPDRFAFITDLFSSGNAVGNDNLIALRNLSERVSAVREERSFVVVLEVWAETPEKSVILSDAIVEAFETELFQAAAESAGRVAENLNARLEQLRINVTEAERKVEDFRRENGLQYNNSELVSNQLSSELNTQVLAAQQLAIQTEAQYEQMRVALSQNRTASEPVFDSEEMTNLRQQFDTLRQQIASLRLTYGERHQRLILARAEETALERAMEGEARRILERAKAEADRNKSAFLQIQSKADDEKSRVFEDNDAQVQLRGLERDARSKAAIYETHLARAQQIAEQQQIDTTNIRVISKAFPPRNRSWPPRTLILLIGGGILGGILGCCLVLLAGFWQRMREFRPETA